MVRGSRRATISWSRRRDPGRGRQRRVESAATRVKKAMARRRALGYNDFCSCRDRNGGGSEAFGKARMFHRFTWILWNLFLASIPVALGYAIAGLGREIAWRRRRWLWAAMVP